MIAFHEFVHEQDSGAMEAGYLEGADLHDMPRLRIREALDLRQNGDKMFRLQPARLNPFNLTVHEVKQLMTHETAINTDYCLGLDESDCDCPSTFPNFLHSCGFSTL